MSAASDIFDATPDKIRRPPKLASVVRGCEQARPQRGFDPDSPRRRVRAKSHRTYDDFGIVRTA
eukprot:2187173-Prorocentrum_lima.AAC.1